MDVFFGEIFWMKPMLRCMFVLEAFRKPLAVPLGVAFGIQRIVNFGLPWPD
jgi:hypothetical protein